MLIVRYSRLLKAQLVRSGIFVFANTQCVLEHEAKTRPVTLFTGRYRYITTDSAQPMEDVFRKLSLHQYGPCQGVDVLRLARRADLDLVMFAMNPIVLGAAHYVYQLKLTYGHAQLRVVDVQRAPFPCSTVWACRFK